MGCCFNDAPNLLSYSLWLVYEKSSFFIRYDASAQSHAVYKICPQFGDNHDDYIVQVELVSIDPAGQMRLEEYDEAAANVPKVLSIGESTGLSIQQFYDTLTRSTIPGCFSTPANMWN